MNDFIDRVYLRKGQVLAILHRIDNQMHQHYPASLLLSFDEPFWIDIKGQAPFYSHISVLRPNETFRNKTEGPSFILHIEPDDPSYVYFARALADQKYRTLPVDHFKAMESEIKAFFHSKGTCSEAGMLIKRVLDQLAMGTQTVVMPELDTRLLKVIALLKAGPAQQWQTDDLAKQVGLSSSRLMYLFKEQMGLPIRRYLMYLKLLEMCRSLSEFGRFTEAAIAAGFADQAHASRTTRQIYGIKPSQLKQSQTAVFDCR